MELLQMQIKRKSTLNLLFDFGQFQWNSRQNVLLAIRQGTFGS